jgi:predicted nucleic acid-binding protein
MNKEIFVDTDIVIDLLTKREPFYQSAAQVFSLAADKKVDLFISPVLISLGLIPRSSAARFSSAIHYE